jgi:hypothetical protein
MNPLLRWSLALILGLVCLWCSALQSQQQPVQKGGAAPPRLEPIAETKLIMEGFAKPNYDGLTKSLAKKPTEQEAWVFIRGQSLLVAESANLLMIRPPRTKQQQDNWMLRATEMRTAAKELGIAAAAKDYASSRTALAKLANQCNRCHADSGIKMRVEPLPAEEK